MARKPMEIHRAYKERAPSIKYYNNYYNHDDVMMMMIKITISICGYFNKCLFTLDLNIALFKTLACINEDISCRQRLIP